MIHILNNNYKMISQTILNLIRIQIMFNIVNKMNLLIVIPILIVIQSVILKNIQQKMKKKFPMKMNSKLTIIQYKNNKYSNPISKQKQALLIFKMVKTIVEN